LSVINGPNSGVTTSVTVQDRLLGVYDGSTIDFNPAEGNKALLSVLDAKLDARALKTNPSSIPLIDIADGFKFDRDGKATPGDAPDVKVTSAVVVRSTVNIPTIPLDGALLEASAPLLALTNATMTTASHFADLAGNQAQSIRLGDALVALGAKSILTVNGSLLNLNAATATLNGYLFSLDGGSKLTINNGALFSLNSGSSLNLNGNAFGVFGSGPNTLSITNNWCGAGATCGFLVDSANQPIKFFGTPLKVAGVSQNVVVPSNFNVFALAAGAPAPTVDTIKITANDALFKVADSTLTIKGTTVVKR
jgi:hypothetical protein